MKSHIEKTNIFLDEFYQHLNKRTSNITIHEKLKEWADYSLLSPCKRLRPMMTFFASDCSKKSFDIALAIELIHTYSLIHDDLPAMDDDDIRRGVKSLHKYANEAGAILTGDMLLTFAFEIISTSSLLNSSEKIKIITLLTKASGGLGLIQGQALDLFELQTTPNKLVALYEEKTSKLFMLALESGSFIGKKNKMEQNLLRKIGLHFGIAFQLLDDLSDKSKILESFSETTIKNLYQEHKNIVFNYCKKFATKTFLTYVVKH